MILESTEQATYRRLHELQGPRRPGGGRRKFLLVTVKGIILFLLFTMPLSYGRNDPIGELFPHSDVFTWPNCDDVKPSDFVEVKLVTSANQLRQPSKVCFIKTSDVPNFYFLEKITGKVRYYVDATKSVEEVGSVGTEMVTGGYEDGLNGIALDYDFDETRWMYLFYSIRGFYRVARYKITAANTMDVDSKQVILDIQE